MSRDIKESIKTALAMTIAYAISLGMDWDRPYWAGFAVAFTLLGVMAGPRATSWFRAVLDALS